jgi:hypothetical protein
LATFDGPVDESSESREVYGLTSLDNKLFVVYDLSPIIYVYATQSSYIQLAYIHVNGLSDPWDIAACSINNCLYVGGKDDVGSHCVWKVKTDHKDFKWLERFGSGQSLSVTSEGHILMLVRSEPHKVDIYDTGGIKLQSLHLPRDITSAWHAVQTANKHFIVCHGYDKGQHRVCEVNNEGVIVKSYGGSAGFEFRLRGPERIIQDSEERVFVADTDNDRVVLLDKQLNIQRVLLTWSRDSGPSHLFYDRVTSKLIVGFDSGKVEIFSLV